MRGTLTGQRYVDDILRPHVGSFINGLPGAIFQQDNARPHTARVAQDFLPIAGQVSQSVYLIQRIIAARFFPG
ncbi:transposable element Tcb2 transposase [Trichonephila clavipes]|nr:transposable element Tcb2 transposase [Trichonephila clavipes]